MTVTVTLSAEQMDATPMGEVVLDLTLDSVVLEQEGGLLRRDLAPYYVEALHGAAKAPRMRVYAREVADG